MARLLFILAVLFLTLDSPAGTSDSLKSMNSILLETEYPFPISGPTFKTVYSGVLSIRGEFERVILKTFYWDIGTNYSQFQIDRKVLDVKTKMAIISAFVGFGWQIVVFNKLEIHTLFNCGYTYITYNGTDADGNSKPKFSEQGVFILPSIFWGYQLSKKTSVGLSSSYKIIFQHFGNNATFEDNNIRIASFGIGLSYKL